MGARERWRKLLEKPAAPLRSAIAAPARDAARCPHGHPYTEANTIVDTRANGQKFRACRECRRRYVRESHRRARDRNRKRPYRPQG